MNGRFQSGEKGQGLVEYGLILGFVGLAAVWVTSFAGVSISGMFADVVASISGVSQ